MAREEADKPSRNKPSQRLLTSASLQRPEGTMGRFVCAGLAAFLTRITTPDDIAVL